MMSSYRILLVLCAVAGSSAARGQQAAPDSADSAKVKLPAVTISATRQRESVFAAPLAVSVVDRAALANKRGYSLDEALANVPGVMAQSRSGGSDIRLVIRGFGARGAGDRSNAGTSRGIRVLLDGIPETEPDGRTSFDLVDLAAAQRTEVVRSNASAIWGNAAGGVVDISTVPEVERAYASAQQVAGSFGLRRTALQAGTRLGTATLAATFTNTSQDGWRDQSDSRRALVNSSLTGSFSERTSFGLFVNAANDLFHIPGPLTMRAALDSPRNANALYDARDERRHNRLGRVGVTLRHLVSEGGSLSGMFFVNPKVLQRSERNTFRDFNRYHLGSNIVYRAAYPIRGGLRGATVAGGDQAFQSGTILFYSLTPAGTRGESLRDNKSEGALNSGLFVQQEFLFGERFNVEAGARYDKISYDYRNFILPSTNAEKSFARITPKIGVSYRPSTLHSYYVNVGGGIEAPAGNETDPASTFGQDTLTAINPLLDAIRSTTYEVGTKRIVMLGGGLASVLAYDAALYWTEVANEIIPYRGGRFYFSAGKVRRQGAELSAQVTGSEGVELRASTTLSHNRYVRYLVDSVHYGRPGAFASYAGNDVAGIADLFYSAAIGRNLGSVIPVRAEISMRGVGDYFTDDANGVLVPGYRTFGFTLASSRPVTAGQFGVRAFATIDNLTNRRYIGSAFVNPDVVDGVPIAFEPGSPRSVVVSLSVGFRQP